MRINSELMDAQLENKASDVTPATTAKGHIYYKSTTEPIKVSDGTTVHKVYTDQMNAAIASMVKSAIESTLSINQSQVSCNYAISASDTETFQTTSTTYVDITNLTISITTTGKPVEITLIPGDLVSSSYIAVVKTGNTLATATFKPMRGATDLPNAILSNGDSVGIQLSVPVSSLRWVDTPAAGTYTYKIQVKTDSASTTAQVLQAKLFVKEL